jgi:phosphoglycolate phosphatase
LTVTGSRFTLIVFDLDGTLIDGYAAIGDALTYAMERLGLPAPGPGEVRALVGHGLEKLLEKAAGPERAADGVRLFRERYPDVAIPKSDLLPGVAEVLAALEERGYVLALASNKPPNFSRLILEAKGVARHFRSIEGPRPDTPAKPDPTMLRRAMWEAGADPGGTLVVGDMEVDSEFARAAGCGVVLIPGGSRSREELAGADADDILETILELPDWLERRSRQLTDDRRQ